MPKNWTAEEHAKLLVALIKTGKPKVDTAQIAAYLDNGTLYASGAHLLDRSYAEQALIYPPCRAISMCSLLRNPPAQEAC